MSRFQVKAYSNNEEAQAITNELIKTLQREKREIIQLDLAGRTFSQAVFEDIDSLIRSEQDAIQVVDQIVNPQWAKRRAALLVTGLSEMRAPNRGSWLNTLFGYAKQPPSATSGTVFVIDTMEFFNENMGQPQAA